jgi:hypothetical protein
MPERWLRDLVATIRACWLWHSPALRLGISYRRPRDRYDHWELRVYPPVQEIVGGHNDGGTVWSGFTVDVSELLEELEAGHISVSTALGTDPPELLVEGRFRGKAVLVRLCLEPPEDAEATEIIDVRRSDRARIRKKR